MPVLSVDAKSHVAYVRWPMFFCLAKHRLASPRQATVNSGVRSSTPLPPHLSVRAFGHDPDHCPLELRSVSGLQPARGHGGRWGRFLNLGVDRYPARPRTFHVRYRVVAALPMVRPSPRWARLLCGRPLGRFASFPSIARYTPC